MVAIAEILDVAPVVGEDALFDRVAAAALDEFAEHGIRRTSMEDIARRAGVSRMTVFRRFASKQRLVEIVIAREVHRGMQDSTSYGKAQKRLRTDSSRDSSSPGATSAATHYSTGSYAANPTSSYHHSPSTADQCWGSTDHSSHIDSKPKSTRTAPQQQT